MAISVRLQRLIAFMSLSSGVTAMNTAYKTYNIGFINSDYRPDETQFDAENGKDLFDLWLNFCEENGFDWLNITYIEQVYE